MDNVPVGDKTPEQVTKIVAALESCHVYTTKDKGVIINYRQDDIPAYEKLMDAFGFAGGTPFKRDGQMWMDRSLPNHIYEIAHPIAVEQQEQRRKDIERMRLRAAEAL
jgi:hypothetical protein